MSNKNKRNVSIFVSIALAIVLLIMCVVTVTYALFSSQRDNHIDINFNNEDVYINASLNANKQSAYCDVTGLKLFRASEELPSVDLIKSANLTLVKAYKQVNVRFKVAFEYYGFKDEYLNHNMTTELKTIISYLNNTLESNILGTIASTPIQGSSYTWVKAGQYYELRDGAEMVTIDTSVADTHISLLTAPISYSGISDLNFSNITGTYKDILNSVSLVLQIEIKDFTSFSNNPVKSYGKVAVFDTLGGDPVTARLIESGSNIILPTATKTGCTFEGWYTSLDFLNSSYAGIAGNEIAQTNQVVKYYAKFRENVYIVTLDPNGGSLDETYILNAQGKYEIHDVRYDQIISRLQFITTKNGYRFEGYVDSGNVKYINEDGLVIKKWDKTQNDTLYASYSLVTYNIIYTNFVQETNVSFDVDPPLPPTQYNAEEGLASIPEPLKNGYSFVGWKVNGGSEIINPFSIPSISQNVGNAFIYRDLYLEAVFMVNTYQATITMDNATLQVISYNIEEGLDVTAYNQAGKVLNVYECENGNWKVGEKYSCNQIIYQKFGTVTLQLITITETINFDLNTTNPNAVLEPFSVDLNSEENLILPNAYCPGYTFVGWYYDRAGTILCDRTSIDRNLFTDDQYMLYAKWQVGETSYLVTLDNGDGVANSSTTFVPCLENGRKGTFVVSSTVTAPTKNGYTFAGYFSKPNGNGVQFYTNTGARAINYFTSAFVDDYEYTYTLYAFYYLNAYTITFYSGSETILQPIYFSTNSGVLVLPRTSKFGYIFSGWKRKGSSENSYTSINVANIAQDLQLEACYVANNYNITYRYLKFSGNTLVFDTTNNTSSYSMDTASITLPKPTLDHYIFVGWQLVRGGGSWDVGHIYNPPSGTFSISGINDGSHFGDVEFVAIYSLVNYEISFEYKINNAMTINKSTVLTSQADIAEYQEYKDTVNSIYITYKTPKIIMRKIVNRLGTSVTNWVPTSDKGFWLTTNNYTSEAEVTISATALQHNVVLRSIVTKSFANGQGTLSNPFQISTADHLRNLSLFVNSQISNPAYANLYYMQTQNIDFGSSSSTPNFTSIGQNNTSKYFKGSYDGGGYTIKNLKTAGAEGSCNGLFGCIYGATIKNVTLENLTVLTTSTARVGGVVSDAQENSEILNCHIISGSIKAQAGSVGGICGNSIKSIVANCSNAASVDGYVQVGGVVGGAYYNSLVYNVVNSGNIKAYKTGNNCYDVGGVIGKLGTSSNDPPTGFGSCVAINLYNSGNVTNPEGSTTYSSAFSSIVGYKGIASFVLNAYSDGAITYLGTSSPNGVVGVRNTTESNAQNQYQNFTDADSKGLINLYYKKDTFTKAGALHNPNNKLGAPLAQNNIIGNDAVVDTGANTVMDATTFGSLSTLYNAWIYDMNRLGNFRYSLKYFVHGESTYTEYSTLPEMLQTLGLEKEDLGIWKKTSGSMELTLENKLPTTSLSFLLIDANGGKIGNGYSRLYSKAKVSSATLYEDTVSIPVSQFTRSGYRLRELNTKIDGTGITLNPSNGSYSITIGDSPVEQRYFAIWEKLFADGDGTEQNPYRLSTYQHLINLAYVVNNNMKYGNNFYSQAYYEQTIDLHLEESPNKLDPVGTNTYPFKGVYNGKGFTIFGTNQLLYATSLSAVSSKEYVGVFGVTNGATVRSLGFNFTGGIRGKNYVGGLVGKAVNSTFVTIVNKNTSVTASDAGAYVGTIIGKAEGSTNIT